MEEAALDYSASPAPHRTLFRTRSMSISQNAPAETEYARKFIDGFKVKFQGDLVENEELIEALTADLTAIRAKYLGEHVLTKLKTNDVKIWVHRDDDAESANNDAAVEKVSSVDVQDSASKQPLSPMGIGSCDCYMGMCHFFRCGKDAVNHRRNIRMNGHIEIIWDSYLVQRQEWGVGGLLLHEFAHAFEFHCVSSEQSDKLKETFENKRQLYIDQNPLAASNEGEFFAELSVAYLGGLDELSHAFPKNIEDLDMDSRALLKEIWDPEEIESVNGDESSEDS